jgi:hypothetical protein
MVSAAEMIYSPHYKRQNDAQQNARHDGKIETRVGSFVRDVAGKATEPKRQFSRSEQERANDRKPNPADQQ